MVASDFAVKLKTRKRRFDMIFVCQIMKKVELTHRGRIMDNIQITAHNERPLNPTDNLSDFSKGFNRICVTDWIGSPKTMMINDSYTVFKLSDLDI